MIADTINDAESSPQQRPYSRRGANRLQYEDEKSQRMSAIARNRYFAQDKLGTSCSKPKADVPSILHWQGVIAT